MRPHDWRLLELDDGWQVSQDRRVLIDQLTEDEARDYVERRRKPDEQVFAEGADGRWAEITESLRKNRRRTLV